LEQLDLPLGTVDAAVIALAERLPLTEIATFELQTDPGRSSK